MKAPLEERYRENVGHEPPVDDSENAWQWEYRGTKAEREALLGRLGLDDDQGEEQIRQDESLFGDAA